MGEMGGAYLTTREFWHNLKSNQFQFARHGDAGLLCTWMVRLATMRLELVIDGRKSRWHTGVDAILVFVMHPGLADVCQSLGRWIHSDFLWSDSRRKSVQRHC